MANLVKLQPANDAARPEAVEPPCRLWLDLEGVTAEEMARGVAAAEAVFVAHGVSAYEVSRAQWIVEGWDIDGFPDPAPERELEVHDLWFEAAEAAVKACRPRWPKYLVQQHRSRLRLAIGEAAAA
jgi:hypothetical protein